MQLRYRILYVAVIIRRTSCQPEGVHFLWSLALNSSDPAIIRRVNFISVHWSSFLFQLSLLS